MWRHLPVEKPSPDAAQFIEILMGRAPQARTPMVEYSVDDVVRREIGQALLGQTWTPYGEDRASQAAYLDNFIDCWRRLGYDYVRLEISLPFPLPQVVGMDPAHGGGKQRSWMNTHHGAVTSWEDFERYAWPSIADVDFFPLEYLTQHLPSGMGFITCHGGGVFEHLSFIMSIEGLCQALCEQPDLVAAACERIGALLEQFYNQILELDRLCAILQGDDMGYRTATMLPPAFLRETVLPWHRRYAALTHARGLPYFLHCCGQVEAIMEDLIEDARIDGKHSFEDEITPVQAFQARYGARLAVLGGLDVNVLAGSEPAAVRARTRGLIETCAPRGRYAIGSGNSIPSYVPAENYLTMVDTSLDMAAVSA